MRIKLILTFILCLCTLTFFSCKTEKKTMETEYKPIETEEEPMDFPYIADSKEVILAWGAQPAFGKPDGYCQNFEYTNGENHVIVVPSENSP
jgi:hypothetical protein